MRVLNEGSPCLKPYSNFHPLNSRVKAIVTSQKWMVYWLSLIRKKKKKASYGIVIGPHIHWGINFNPCCSEANKIPYDLKRTDPVYIKSLAIAFNNHFCWRIVIPKYLACNWHEFCCRKSKLSSEWQLASK